MKEFLKSDMVQDLCAEVLGNILIAISLLSFVITAEIPMSGFSGIALLFYRFFNLPIGITTLVLNIPVVIICWNKIGRRFVFKSLRCMIFSAILTDVLGVYVPVYEGDRLLAAALTGAIGGMGYALIYMRHSSTGGADFVIMAVKSAKPHVKLSAILFLLDTLIIVLGGIVMKTFDGIVYGMIVNLINSTVVDKLMMGVNKGMIGMIITDDGKAVSRCIDRETQRGSTIIPAIGAYSGERKDLVLVASSPKEMYLIRKEVKDQDEKSFMIIMNSNEVHGEGFRMI